MKINILMLPEAGLDLHFDLQGEWFRSFLADEESDSLSLRETAVDCHVSRMGEAVFIQGEIRSVVDALCSRCLDAVHLPVRLNFRYTLLPVKENIKDNMELRTEDLDFGFYEGEVVDLTPLIYEQIMLQIPMKVLCREACKGLCPQCGTNLNVRSCDCRREQGDARFAVLKDFKIAKKPSS